jgi:endogenous inhibitor of DNA gyrase (YacG/DUF329 family)
LFKPKCKVNCKYCGKEYEVIPYRKNKTKFCSYSCKSKSQPKGDSSPYWKGRLIQICPNCGKEFEIRTSKKGLRKFCSLNCKMSGKFNRFWRGGRAKLGYGIEFNNALKDKIRKRDNLKCLICGLPEDKSYRKLCIHHIDENKYNNNLDNLISVCSSCHTIIHNKKEKINGNYPVFA